MEILINYQKKQCIQERMTMKGVDLYVPRSNSNKSHHLQLQSISLHINKIKKIYGLNLP